MKGTEAAERLRRRVLEALPGTVMAVEVTAPEVGLELARLASEGRIRRCATGFAATVRVTVRG